MIGIIGLNHKSASIEIREKFSLSNEQIRDFTDHIKGSSELISEITVITTCNRTEFCFYGQACESGNMVLLSRAISGFFKVSKETLDRHFYQYNGFKAVRHLFRVAAGLDSMLLGEYQIVNQLKSAYQYSHELNATGKYLNRLFHKALEAGKKVRTQTSISDGANSLSYVAVDKCNQFFNNLAERNIMVIGAGETGSLVVKKLEKQGCRNITLANRTLSRAQEVTGNNGQAIELGGIASSLQQADVIITTTGSADAIVTQQMVAASMETRPDQPLLLVDLAVPRNIAPQVAEVNNVSLLNVDDLEVVIEDVKSTRAQAVHEAEAIIEDAAIAFNDWLKLQNLSPVIREIKRGLGEMNDKEMRSFSRQLSEEEKEAASQYADHLTDKYARQLIKNLRKVTNNGRRTELTDLLGDIFKV